ncbi:MAG: hypothetical protein ACYDG2_04040 [Ruminiclostridium sp.]
MKKKIAVFVLAMLCICALASCSSDKSQSPDMTKVIEARTTGETLENNLLSVNVYRVYIKDAENLDFDTYYVDITDADMQISVEVLKDADYPIWIEPTETFTGEEQTISAKTVGGFGQ